MKSFFSLSLVLMISVSTSCVQTKNSPLVIGHRGARGYVAENTVASVKKALELGVDGIEIDVFRCKTGELVVFHDQTLEKLTNASGYIEQLDLDSIRKITVLDKEPIPTLSEVLDVIDGKVTLNIELKGSQTALPTISLLKIYFESGKLTPNDVFISSFNWEELTLFYQESNGIPIAVLTEGDPLDAIPIAKKLNAFAINPDFKSLTKSNFQKMHKAGFEVYPWTINSYEDIDYMKSIGVDAIITDFPDRVNP